MVSRWGGPMGRVRRSRLAWRWPVAVAVACVSILAVFGGPAAYASAPTGTAGVPLAATRVPPPSPAPKPAAKPRRHPHGRSNFHLPSGVHPVCSAPARGRQARCMALVRTAPRHGAAADTPAGYGPGDLQAAYQLPSSSAGGGQTVAIVDAFDDPNAEADLATYRAQYGLTPCTSDTGCFTKVNQNGAASPLPAASGASGWATEESLDIDMVAAICPNCRILLVEANSASINDLGTAVNSAVALGAKFVSNSYGAGEFDGETGFDAAFYDHLGVAVTASSGDDGFGVSFPAASPHVTAVGGTSLSPADNDRGWTETAWGGAGSGCSSQEGKPAWQVDPGCGDRTVADVSAVADPSTPVAVYDSYDQGGWTLVGGTSVAAPIIASVYALAGTPTPASYPAAYPYAHPHSLFDVTSGSNGVCDPAYVCTAGPGYDGPTGLGTPIGTAAFTAQIRAHTSPASAALAGGGHEAAFQANTGNLWVAGDAGTADLGLGMAPGTSPSITGLTGGGYEVAFQANTGTLWVTGDAGTADLGLGMAAGTSPAIAALAGGGYEVAFQANTGHLWVTGSEGTADLGLGMAAGTGPGIAGLAGGGYEAAFQANTGNLWVAGDAGTADLGLGMAAGTDPAIAGLGTGGYEAAFQANTGNLWVTGNAGTADLGLGMAAGTGPGIAGLAGGGYQAAFQANTGNLWVAGDAGTADLGLGMAAGTDPGIAGLAGGGYEAAFQANTGNLWVAGNAGTADLGLGMA